MVYSKYMWSVKGYENQKLFLDNALVNNKLAHAYLFTGSDRETKKQLAIEFARMILGVSEEEKERINPDLIVIDQSKMKIEEMRDLISELSLKPFRYQKKVAIIQNFEDVTDEAASSILKTLEEPNNSSLIILLSRNQKSLLPTIVSRCQSIYFNIPKQKISNENTESLKSIFKFPIAQRILSIKGYAEKETEELQSLFEDWINAERESLLSGDAGKYLNLQVLLDSLVGLKQNLNKKLILERLFLSLK
ncbi:MAG: hypothetical protein AAB351_00325 [Patescibacteria group bacterium]